MRRISAQSTLRYKRLFPPIFLSGWILFAGLPAIFGSNQAEPIPYFNYIFPAFTAYVSFIIMKKYIFTLVDEVWDDGNALVVRNRGQEERIALRDIKDINCSSNVNWPRATLMLQRPTVFGDKITFAVPVHFMPSATSPIIKDLIERVDAARQQRA